MKRGDLWLIAIVLIALGITSWMMFQQRAASDSYDGVKYARITVDRDHYRTVRLDEEQMIEIRTKYGYNLLQVKDGGVRMIEGDCRDDLCVLMGFKDRIGDTIVCLPNRVLVEIIGEHGEEADVDAVVS